MTEPEPLAPPADADADVAASEAAYHHGKLRAALIESALELLESDGLPAFTLRGVCARAGVSHTAPRNHFGDFSGLRTAVAAIGFEQLGAAIAGALKSAGPARADGGEAVIHAYVDFAAHAPALFQLMFEHGPLHDRGGPAAAAAQAALAPFFSAARGLEHTPRAEPMEGGLSEGYYLWSLAHGHAQLAAAGAYGLMAPGAAVGELLAPIDPAAPRRAAGPVEDAEESVVVAPAARRMPVIAPDFACIAPRLRFAQAFKFETLDSAAGAPILAAPKKRGAPRRPT